ncbi:MAG: hypothetical protein ACREKE_09535 [bacterium]
MEVLANFIDAHRLTLMLVDILLLSIFGAFLLVFARWLGKIAVSHWGAGKSETELKGLYRTALYSATFAGAILLGRAIWAIHRLIHGS